MKRFLNIVTPMPFESLHSLLYRTLKVNHFPHPSTILKEMSLRLYDNSCNYIDEKRFGIIN